MASGGAVVFRRTRAGRSRAPPPRLCAPRSLQICAAWLQSFPFIGFRAYRGAPMVLHICVESSRVFNAGQGCVLELVPSGATTIIALYLLDMGTGLCRQLRRIIIPVIFPPMGEGASPAKALKLWRRNVIVLTVERQRCFRKPRNPFKVAVKAQKCLVTFIFYGFFGPWMFWDKRCLFFSQMSARLLSQGRCFVRLLSPNFDRRGFDVFLKCQILSAHLPNLVFPFIMIRPGETKKQRRLKSRSP